MKTKKTSAKQAVDIKRVATVVGVLLLIPLFGNFFIDGWNWSFGDFVIMASLMFGTGLALDFVSKKVTNPGYRSLTLIAIVGVFLAIWSELAVDAVSQALSIFF